MTKRLTLAILALVLTIFACVWIGRQTQTSARQQTLDSHLISAVHRNDLSAATRLLDAGANPNARMEDFLTPVRRLSLAWRDPQTNGYLLNPRASPRFAPALLWEARVFHKNTMAALLISRGANPNVSAAGVPPLIDIVLQNDTPMLKTFLSGGANVNACDTQKGMTALMSAASRGRTRDVKLLLDRGASVHLKDKAGKTALTLAQENKRAEAVKLLTAAGGTH